MKISYFFSIFFLFCLNLNGQKSYLIVNTFIKLPNDTLQSKRLIEALDKFLIAAENPNDSNKYVLPEEKIQTFVLLDEIKGMGYSGKYKDDHFYKPYLTNVVELKDHQFLIQFNYMGATEQTPLLRGGFEVIAHKNKESFLFASPLTYRTRDWKTFHDGNFVIHFRNSLDKNKVSAHIKLSNLFDQKLNNLNKISEYYCCENFPELQQLIGITYKADYNGSAKNVLSAADDNKNLILLGDDNANFQNVDPHDLWHDRLSLAISRNDVYKPVDEGYAYLYGGSWGITWKEILEQFKSKVAIDKQTDWMNLKEKPLNFGVSQDKHLYADYVVNALLLDKIEKEHGFDGVWQMLKSVDKEQGNDLYYTNLEKLTGITKGNYNEKVWELISALDKYSMLNKDGFFLIDKSGTKIYEIFPYDNGPDYVSEGLQRIIKDGKIGYGDPILGKIMIQPIYACAYPFENGRAKVSIDCTTVADGEHSTWESKEWIYIDKNGKISNQ